MKIRNTLSKDRLKRSLKFKIIHGQYRHFALMTTKLFKNYTLEIDESTETALIYTKTMTLKIQQDLTHSTLIHITKI